MSQTGEQNPLDVDAGKASSPSAWRELMFILRSPDILFPNVLAGAILAVLSITTAISVGALIFSGPLSPFLSMGIGLLLVGTMLGSIFVAAGGNYKAIFAGPRSGQAPILASLAAGIVAAMAGQPMETIAVTVVVAIFASSIFIGILLYVLGWAKLGIMARYIPFPVMAGFFAGMGFLLVKGGTTVAISGIADISSLNSMLSPDSIVHLAPTFGFAFLLYALEKRISHWILTPAFLLVSFLMFYAVLALTNSNLDTAIAGHWLPSIPGSAGSYLPVITLREFITVDWSAIIGQASTILVLALLAVIMLLLDTSGIEITLDHDLDTNRELISAGRANIVLGLMTGPPVIQSAADTAMAKKLGGDRFIVVIAHAIVAAIAIIVGPEPIAYLPKFILGGLLIYIGISFLDKWVWQVRSKLPISDFAVICCILLAVAVYGIIQGVAVGVALATVLFVHQYSQLSTIKSSLNAAEHVSNIDRSAEDRHYLDQSTGRLQIFVLQGFLFFGTATRLLEQIRLVLRDPAKTNVKYLVLDFRHVDALDTSAVNSFAKLMQVCMKERLALVLTGCSTKISQRLDNVRESVGYPEGRLQFFVTLDDGIGWCDDETLSGKIDRTDGERVDPAVLLSDLLGDKAAAKTIARSFVEVELQKDDILFEQGDAGDALYLILSGAISINISLPDGQALTVRTMRAGAVLGEMALYTGEPRSAAAVAKQDCVLFKLDADAYDALRDKHPRKAAFFHMFIIRLLSERLGRANRSILALSR